MIDNKTCIMHMKERIYSKVSDNQDERKDMQQVTGRLKGGKCTAACASFKKRCDNSLLRRDRLLAAGKKSWMVSR